MVLRNLQLPPELAAGGLLSRWSELVGRNAAWLDALRQGNVSTDPLPFVRPVVLALEPLDLEKTLGAESDEDKEKDEDVACVTVSECVARNKAIVDGYVAQNPELGPIIASIADQCWKDHAASVPFPVSNCE